VTQKIRPIWSFLMSVKFGVVLIVFLMVTMMFATQFEASTSTRAMKHFIYGSKWFDAAVYVFVVNIIVNTLRRRPWGFRHIGFLTVHVGVLACVAGGMMSRYFAVDGSMPIEEGGMSREISLPENDLIVEAGGRVARHVTHYELKPESEHADLYEVPGTVPPARGPLLSHGRWRTRSRAIPSAGCPRPARGGRPDTSPARRGSAWGPEHLRSRTARCGCGRLVRGHRRPGRGPADRGAPRRPAS
jgi:hypothetical protein